MLPTACSRIFKDVCTTIAYASVQNPWCKVSPSENAAVSVDIGDIVSTKVIAVCKIRTVMTNATSRKGKASGMKIVG